jgi:multidrug resistance efflux pump
VLAGAAWYGWDYWTVGQYLVSTDDAYVKADNTTIAPKVSGYLREVLVGDNEPVKTGEVLARIDERDFKVALDQAKSDVAAANAAIASKQAQLGVQQAVIDRDVRGAGEQALRRSRRDRLWQRAERAAGTIAYCRSPGRSSARHRQPCLRIETG